MDESSNDLIPESYNDSQQQEFTQTQTQTQTQATQGSQTQQTFPAHLWGILVSCSPAPTEAQLEKENAASGEAYVERPARVELAWNENPDGLNECTIGRNPKANIILNGKKISSWHAKLWATRDEEGVRLEDTSTNGTFVRGQKVGKGKVTLLEHGDEVIFGPPSPSFTHDFRYIFQAPSSVPITETTGIHAFYDVREQIGKGSFATVRKGIQRSTGNMVAIKIIQKARFASNPKTMEMIQREVEIMKGLDHKYCVQYIDYFEDKDKMWLVLEYVDGGDVLDYIMKHGGLAELVTREIALMVCEAVAYLHSKGVAHRDLKPENLLLTKGSRPLCKVTDFGLAKMVDNNTMLKTACGTPSYLAPEVILNNNPEAGYGEGVDAWSIGVVLYSCLTNATPFDESESTPLPQRMAERRIDFSHLRELGTSELAIDFLRQLLITDPRERMSVTKALEHPWLATSTADGVVTSAQPLVVSSLPFNSGVEVPRVTTDTANTALNSNETPSATSMGISYEDSFSYSQKMDNLRLNTPGRSSAMQSASQTTPDRTVDAEDDAPVTEAGDDSHDLRNSLPTPNHVVNQLKEDQSMASAGQISPSFSLKRKQPASAFSSSSSNGHEEVAATRMQIDGDVASPHTSVGVNGDLPKTPVALSNGFTEHDDDSKTEGDGADLSSTVEVMAEIEGEEKELSTRKSRRTSGAAASAKGRGTPGTRRKARADPVDETHAVEEEVPAGPVTRRRAKAARLS